MAGNSQRLLLKNVRIFDGLTDRVSDGHVLIDGADDRGRRDVTHRRDGCDHGDRRRRSAR